MSVVIPLFNKGGRAGQAVQSVLRQTMADFELVVVNDGSTDEGPAAVRAIPDPRVTVIDQANAGVSAARNRGIEAARAPLVAFLDADDVWEDTFLETVVALQREFRECRVFGTGYLFRDISGRTRAPLLHGIPVPGFRGVIEDYFSLASRSDPPLLASAIAVAKEALRDVGGFPGGVAIGEDLLTWARLASRFRIAYDSAPKAVFNLGISLLGRPSRVPEARDVVGEGLRTLLAEVAPPQQASVRRYVATWHRMRTSMYLALGKRRDAAREARLMIAFAPWSVRNWFLRAFTWAPLGLHRPLGWLLGVARLGRRVVREAVRGSGR